MRAMENKKINTTIKKGKNRETEESLPFCMKAPGAEHSRAHDNDEPCDDGRTGKLDKQ
jgi:hypothetical protein